MLGDISNYSPAVLATLASPGRAAAKQLSNARVDSLPSGRFPRSGVLHETRCSSDAVELSASSSSSPSRAHNRSSSPFFTTTHLEAFDASSSPAPPCLGSKLPPSSPILRLQSLSSLPPSSPAFVETTPAHDEFRPASPFAREDTATIQDEPLALSLDCGTVLYFGRKAKKAIARPPRSSSPGFSPSDRAIPVLLPRSAKNASRIHCSARIVDRRRGNKVTLEVRVTGQNGMKIDGKRWKVGEVARFKVERGRQVELSFWGWDAIVTVAANDKNEAEPSVRASSPVNSDDDRGDDEFGGARTTNPAATKRRRVAPSPAPSCPSEADSLLQAPLPSLASIRARALADSPSFDLAGLLASTIVFHPRSTVGVDELVRALLKESGQGMWSVLSDERDEVERLKDSREGEERAVEAWSDVCQAVLASERMFGMIDNTGLKDASGHPLPPYYYYIPDLDPSPSRVEALEPFVKRVRGARTAKPVRYFWAKPSLKKNK
ncbi:hypothetical protein JCM10212_006316 [Sporobolomyces blumeae]